MFIVSSQTTWGLTYEVFINQFGQVTCECMDAGCRKKSPHFVDLIQGHNNHACKHMRAIIKELNKCHSTE